MLSCGCRFDEDPVDEGSDDPDPEVIEITVPEGGAALFDGRSEVLFAGTDANGVPLELHRVDGVEVIVHVDAIPDCDRTVIDGVPCTTPLRTVIDLAPELSAEDLRHMIDVCLHRGLFTVEDALRRLDQPDMERRPGALLLRSALE